MSPLLRTLIMFLVSTVSTFACEPCLISLYAKSQRVHLMRMLMPVKRHELQQKVRMRLFHHVLISQLLTTVGTWAVQWPARGRYEQ